MASGALPLTAMPHSSRLVLKSQSITSSCVVEWHRVNAVCPGPILTEGTARHAANEGKSVEEICADMTSGLILRRMGRVEEVAAAVAFLASEESSFMTGTHLTVDGGLMAL